MEEGGASSKHYESVMCSPYEEHRYCTAIRSIDTVRALHQTVVSLRTALEESRQEIEKLKKQILVSSEIQDARQCHHPEIALQQQQVDYKTLGDKVSELEKIYFKAHPQHTKDESLKRDDCHSKERKSDGSKKTISLVPDITISTQNLNDSSIQATGGSAANSLANQMASRIDVKIKVSSNINVSDNNNDTSTEDGSEVSETPQPSNADDAEGNEGKDENENKPDGDDQSDVLKRENPKVEVEMYEDSNTNTFNVDAKNLKIKVTSEDTINVRRSVERISVQQSSTEYLNLDIDDLSEGDNSVFTEGATTPIEQRLQVSCAVLFEWLMGLKNIKSTWKFTE